jgi:hypothetical protein
MGSSIVVVRHGPGRGRLRGYMDPVLEGLRAREPARAARVRVHETGGPPPSLDGVEALLFWLADPLRERYPDCHAEAVALADEARARGIALVNPPECLSNSEKSRQSRAWRAAGFDTPPWRRFEEASRLPGLAREIGFPLLVRADEEHAQRGLHVLRGPRELAALDPARLRLPGAVAPLWDVREGWRAAGARGIYARLHHKKRLYVLGDRVLDEHVFFSAHPVVSADTCTFARFHGHAWLHGLARLLERDRAAICEDVAYWRRGEEQRDLMRHAAGVLGFGYAAIDYSTRADGSAVLWEANPHPMLPSLAQIRLPRQRLGAQRVESYHRAIADFLLRLLDGDAPSPKGRRAHEGPDRRLRG